MLLQRISGGRRGAAMDAVVVTTWLHSCVGRVVTVHPHEISSLLHSSGSFFFLLGAYFMVIPFRDEAAISLGENALPLLFVASLVLTLVAAPISSYLLSMPSLSKSKNFNLGIRKSVNHQTFTSLRVCFYIWVALLNLFTTSALWTRLADIMNSEAGSRLFGFVGAGATLGQLAGSIIAVLMAPFGSFLLLFSALFMECSARCALRIGEDHSVPLTAHTNKQDTKNDNLIECEHTSLVESIYKKISSKLEGLWMIFNSSYLLHICLFLWLTAIVSSLFYFQRVNVVAGYTHDPLQRRMLLAKINSITAVFILVGQLSVTGHILSYFGVTVAICASPIIAFISMAVISVSPVPTVIAVSEASRKVTTYVLTKPGREVLFTVISHEEKYKAKVFIDTFVQRLGDAAAAGLYEAVGILLQMQPSTVAFSALPVCFVWFLVALTLGRRQHKRAHTQLTV